jgi:flagellar biogenesis protein FliO
MGNLQVIKIRRGREWTPHSVSLGALIRNGMEVLTLFLFLTYCFKRFIMKLLDLN